MAPEPRPLRPPGAEDEATFLSLCVRCGGCIASCPYGSIVALPETAGALAGTPAIEPREIPCYLCMVCPSRCPTGALSSVAKVDVRMGLAIIDEASCLAYRGTPCRACVDACPLREKAIALDEASRPRVDAQGCVGCGICVAACPVEGAPAIDVVAWGAIRGEE